MDSKSNKDFLRLLFCEGVKSLVSITSFTRLKTVVSNQASAFLSDVNNKCVMLVPKGAKLNSWLKTNWSIWSSSNDLTCFKKSSLQRLKAVICFPNVFCGFLNFNSCILSLPLFLFSIFRQFL